MPQFSIIIPTHNRPNLLRRAVTSAVAAAGSNGEVIVVDDGSDAAASDALSDFSGAALRVLRHDVALAAGGSPARNTGAAASEAPLLFFLDDDDELCSDYCDRIIDEALPNGAAFGFSARYFVSDTEEGEPETVLETRRLGNGIVPDTARFYDKTFPFSAGFWMTKETYEVVGPFATNLSTNSDTEYTCRLYASGRTPWYSEVPGVRVYDPDQKPSSEIDSVTRRTKSADRAAAFRAIAETNAKFLKQDSSAARFVYGRLMKHSFRAGHRMDALVAALHVGLRALV